MATIVYLDAEDEITSAASRLRTAAEEQVALVVPYGSRVATSRINFRLLAREAQARGRQLGIVAGEAGTRALAASAGLPVFGSVGEYESALRTAGGPGPAERGGTVPGEADAAPRIAPGRSRSEPGRTPGDDAADRAERRDLDRTAVLPAGGAPDAARTRERSRARSTEPRVVAARPPGRRRMVALFAILLLALASVVGGVAAYVYLPSAEILLTPRVEAVGPVQVAVRAEPGITAPDVGAGLVPAERVTFEATASDTFPATGRRVEETAASGRVTFSNFNTGDESVIPAGSIVSTEGGIQFRTTAAVRLARARIIPPSTIQPSTGSVDVVAVRAGPGGNVPANAIRIVPAGKDPEITKVNNASPTSGGSRREIPRVAQADVDRALEELAARVRDALDERLADPSLVPPNTTLFPETAQLQDPEPTTDPAGIVGTEVASFELGMTATGSVTAVDDAPVASIAEARILERIGPEHRLIDGSVEVEVGEPTIEGETVLFPATARASRVRILDADSLLEQVKGRPIPEARALLEPYGTVRISVWPDWVTSVPTLEDRISLVVGDPEPAPAP